VPAIHFVGDVVAGRPILDAVAALSGARLTGISGPDEPCARVARERAVPFVPLEQLTDPQGPQDGGDAPDLVVNFNSTALFGEALLAWPRLGAINFHPGPLPEYAGLHVWQWGILRGEQAFGATIHRMVPAIDAGDVVALARFPIAATDTGLTLYLKTLRAGTELLCRVLGEVAATGRLAGTPQDLSRRRYYSRRAPYDGVLSWTWTARQIVDFVRALAYRPFTSPSAPPLTFFREKPLEPARAAVGPDPGPGFAPGVVVEITEQGVLAACGVGQAVLLRELVRDGRAFPAARIAREIGLGVGDALGR